MAVSFAAKIRALFRDRRDLDKPEKIQARSVFVFGTAGTIWVQRRRPGRCARSDRHGRQNKRNHL